jgi:chromosome segregation ATPase
MDRDLEKAKEEVQSLKKTNEQLKMELIIANQTIEEQYKTITKNNRELQVHHEREYYLTQKYTDEMEIKSINEENIRGESLYYRDEIHKLKGKLKMAEERAEEEASKASELSDSLHRLDNELANRGQGLMRLGEEKLTL